ncbi:MAG: TIGR03435 family protein [Bryobacteraceae bacterium]
MIRCISLLLLICGLTSAQTFDVTSVKPRPVDRRPEAAEPFGCASEGRFVSQGVQVNRAIQWAFDIKPFQLKSLPAWVNAADGLFDIEAKASPGLTQEQCKAMVRQLLADRFRLQTHRENQNAKVVLLIVGKDGPKMQRPVEGSTESGVKLTFNGSPVRAPAGAPSDLRPPLGWTMAQLADSLGIAFAFDGGEPVIDRTGLEGIFRITLDFGVVFPGQPATLEHPDVFQAVQTLGLKLERATEPFPMLVIDRLEKPDAN